MTESNQGQREYANSRKRDEQGLPLEDVSHIIQETKSRIELEAEQLAGVTLLASHNPPCRGAEQSLDGDKIAHPVINVYSNGTIEVICPYINGTGRLEITHCARSLRYNNCIFLKHKAHTVLR